MGTTQNKNNGLEEARYEIEKSKIVVHGAKITCDYSVTGKVDNYLSVTDGHGILENGKNCAHDESCIPMKNIQPFKACKSPYVETALKELSVNASAGDKTRYEAALKVIADNRLARKDKEVPCTIPLLDRWFDGDERELVTDSMMMGVELKGNLAAIQSTISNDLSTKGFYYLQLSKDRELSKEKRDACKELGNKIIKDKETINEIFRYIYDELNTRIQIEGDDFSDIKGELKDVKGKVESIRDICINVEANYTELDNYESYKDSLDTYIEELKNIIDRLNSWKEKEYHLITTDSFLVCRCGGIITIEDSGQDYGELVEMLHANLLTVLSQFKEHCKTQSDYEVDETMYYLGLERNSYKAALKGLGDFEKLMIGDDGGKETGDVSVYLELICHSYNDEMSKTMMSILALIS